MRRTLAWLAALVVAVTVLPVPPVGGSTAPATDINWEPCYQVLGPFECAIVRVPLDHERPTGKKIDIALARLPAGDPEARIGSIFLNPGGPGGSGVDMLLFAGPLLFSNTVRSRFDLVGFDPRGILRSDPLLCFDTLDEVFGILPPFAFPVTAEEEAVQATADGALDAACQADGGDIKDHMATADVARDLDYLRQMVGDEGLSFAGYSYGSFLGVTYANMFPDKVRAVVVDGVLDPIAWTTGSGDADVTPFSTRLRSDAGAKATLDEFFRLCDVAGSAGCAFAGDSAARFAALADALLASPIEIVDPFSGETFLLTYADLIGFMLGSLYGSDGWASTAEVLADIEAQADPAVLGVELEAAWQRTGLADRYVRYPNFIEGFVGVACSDSDNPDDHSFWSAAGADADANFGYFGRPWTWASSPCASWSAFDAARYMGPFTAATANPVLVVGTRFDPATRYEGAELVRSLLPASSLLTVEGWGHTSLFLSRCADRVVSQYLLTGRARPQGATCYQDFDPFGAAAAFASDEELVRRSDARRRVMANVALFPGR